MKKRAERERLGHKGFSELRRKVLRRSLNCGRESDNLRDEGREFQNLPVKIVNELMYCCEVKNGMKS